MDMDKELTVGWDRLLTLKEVKALSFGKLEGLTRPSLSGVPGQAVVISAGLLGLRGDPSCI